MTVSTQFRDDLRGEEKARIAEIIWGASIPTPSILLALFFSLSPSAISPPPFDPLCTSFYVFPRATETRVTRGLRPHLGRLFVASAQLFSTDLQAGSND